MTLAELIAALEAENPAKVLPHGFTRPHSYRGDYMDLSFEPASNITVAAMLAAARSALGATFHGYKGGEYVMREYTDCWLAEYGCIGETIGPLLLRLMLANGTVTDPNPMPEAEAAMRPKSLARLFHETYERLAPEHGYETRKASAVPWEAVPAANKSLMIAVAGEVLPAVRAKVAEEIAAVWPDPFGNWSAEQADAARAMKEHILRLIARGEQPHG